MIIIFLLARGTVGASHLHSRKGERPPPRRDTADVRVFVRRQQQAGSVRWHSSQSIVGLPTAFAGFVDLIVLVGSLHHRHTDHTRPHRPYQVTQTLSAVPRAPGHSG
jgi:hypothetical protein